MQRNIINRHVRRTSLVALTMKDSIRYLMTSVAVICSFTSALFLPLPLLADGRPYTVKQNNKVDSDTFIGYKVYRTWCARCHGTFGQGLAASDLTKTLKNTDRDDFFKIVARGKKGRIGVMPAWQSNDNVMKNRDRIYSYLRARADGALGAVTPELID
ncbi:c-type cytochrome [Methylophaga sulfidovorans]|uniref:Cytochrome c, mono-and diheme variants n=1 Tax=Methylophaga sulfidovorans TaxID=45496 RepID=A0A1I3ZAJ7_9GAMM|nr:cytochrome c [Methylophaga sulfidovorans]SFK40721.1 Cytochrome c, mono-and diheme variants [Methylophaga sulfidovorans]